MSKRLISEKELLYVVSYTIEAMNRHFATDGSDEPEPQDIVNLALDENEVSQDPPGGLEHASTVGIEHFNN
tara:strand:- start:27 stop:239 length:213 start_codon:yes stop_codon:yes gene_type:complete